MRRLHRFSPNCKGTKKTTANPKTRAERNHESSQIITRESQKTFWMNSDHMNIDSHNIVVVQHLKTSHCHTHLLNKNHQMDQKSSATGTQTKHPHWTMFAKHLLNVCYRWVPKKSALSTPETLKTTKIRCVWAAPGSWKRALLALLVLCSLADHNGQFSDVWRELTWLISNSLNKRSSREECRFNRNISGGCVTMKKQMTSRKLTTCWTGISIIYKI